MHPLRRNPTAKTVATKQMIEDAATREHALFDCESNHFEDERGMQLDEKKCSKCGEVKPFSEFYS